MRRELYSDSRTISRTSFLPNPGEKRLRQVRTMPQLSRRPNIFSQRLATECTPDLSRTIASHGCVRVPAAMAKHFFDAAEIGTRVEVIEPPTMVE
jgi:L,D-transpeptidase catalytic domain